VPPASLSRAGQGHRIRSRSLSSLSLSPSLPPSLSLSLSLSLQPEAAPGASASSRGGRRDPGSRWRPRIYRRPRGDFFYSLPEPVVAWWRLFNGAAPRHLGSGARRGLDAGVRRRTPPTRRVRDNVNKSPAWLRSVASHCVRVAGWLVGEMGRLAAPRRGGTCRAGSGVVVVSVCQPARLPIPSGSVVARLRRRLVVVACGDRARAGHGGGGSRRGWSAPRGWRRAMTAARRPRAGGGCLAHSIPRAAAAVSFLRTEIFACSQLRSRDGANRSAHTCEQCHLHALPNSRSTNNHPHTFLTRLPPSQASHATRTSTSTRGTIRATVAHESRAHVS
jgi:hypothetical protein